LNFEQPVVQKITLAKVLQLDFLSIIERERMLDKYKLSDFASIGFNKRIDILKDFICFVDRHGSVKEHPLHIIYTQAEITGYAPIITPFNQPTMAGRAFTCKRYRASPGYSSSVRPVPVL